MPINKEAKRQLKYIGKLYKLICGLQGTDEFGAYFGLFSGTRLNPETDYRMLNDGQNRQLMVALYNGTSPSIEQLAEATGLKSDDITTRIELFRANGMKNITIRNAA